MALKIRRGTESQRTGITFAAGELIWTTNGHKMYVGDGVTPGGIDIASQLGGNGVVYNQSSGKFDIDLTNVNSDSLTEGTNHLFFTNTRAQAGVGNALVTGNPYNTGITFSYDDVNHRITAIVSANLGLPDQVGHPDQFLKTDGAGTLSWALVPSSGIANVSDDLTPSLGGNLNLSSYNIEGTGNINLIGSVTATQVETPLLTSLTGQVVAGTPTIPTGLAIHSDLTEGAFDVYGKTNVVMQMFAANGTLAAPTASLPNDNVAGLKFHGYSGTTYQTVGGIFVVYEDAGTSTTDPDITMKGTIALASGNGTNVNFATFNSGGVFNSPIFKLTNHATANLPTSPEPGWMAYDSDTNQFKGWNGSTWVVLG